METLTGILRCLLPARYWDDMGRGALLSVFATAALGVWIGLEGFLGYVGEVGAASAQVAMGGGVSKRQIMGMGSISPIAFFLFTPLGWLTDYLVLSAAFRALTLATDEPWGDPILTVIDRTVRSWRERDEQDRAARARETAEGPVVPDQILECRKFAGKEADFVVVSSRRKDGWTLQTTVIAGSVRLRLGEPRELTMEGFLRTCYPLKVIRDLQVDRRVVFYDWPTDAPALPVEESEDDQGA